MNLSKNTGIRLVLENPIWDKTNIFGTVIKDNGNSIGLETGMHYSIDNAYGNKLNLIPLNAKSFKSLLQYYAEEASVYLIDENSGNQVFFSKATVVVD